MDLLAQYDDDSESEEQQQPISSKRKRPEDDQESQLPSSPNKLPVGPHMVAPPPGMIHRSMRPDPRSQGPKDDLSSLVNPKDKKLVQELKRARVIEVDMKEALKLDKETEDSLAWRSAVSGDSGQGEIMRTLMASEAGSKLLTTKTAQVAKVRHQITVMAQDAALHELDYLEKNRTGALHRQQAREKYGW